MTAGSLATADSFEFVALDLTDGSQSYHQAKLAELRRILGEIALLQPDACVFLIGRYHHNVPVEIRALQAEFSGLSISYFTAHRVKGMTCDFAVILDVDSGTLGFPSEVADDPLLNCLLQEGDLFVNAEERRVFYVAITRARHKNYLLYNLVKPSKFIDELRLICGYGEENGESVVKCPECKGILLKRKGPYSEFYGCSNYPRCEVKLTDIMDIKKNGL